MRQRLLCEPAELNRLLAGLADREFTNFRQFHNVNFLRIYNIALADKNWAGRPSMEEHSMCFK